MRHRKKGRKLGRTSSHRKSLFRNQVTALFEQTVKLKLLIRTSILLHLIGVRG